MLLSSSEFDKAFGRGTWDFSVLPAAVPRCPYDRTVMRALVHDGVEIDLCPTCRAIWLDHGEYEKILEKTRAKRRRRDSTEIDLSGSSSSNKCEVDDKDFDMDSVVDFVGEIAGSFLDGL